MCRKRRRDAAAGFLLVEVLVALAVLSAILAGLGGVLAMTSRSARGLEERLALASVAESVLTDLDRATLAFGRSAGMRDGRRWQLDVAPLPAEATGVAAPQRWRPAAVTLAVEGERGALQVTTVRLVPQSP